MKIKELEIQDEGSWALMIEECNVKAIQQYHGGMANLNIDYYLSIGKNRWYKDYFEKQNILFNRDRMINFLLNDEKYSQCVSEIENILLEMGNVDKEYKKLNLIGKFDLYCNILYKYIAYYNSVIADTFYYNVYMLVDSRIPEDLLFVSNHIKDSLFATNNNDLLSHTQTVDLLTITEKYLEGKPIDNDIKNYAKKYKSTTSSSGNPNGITEKEIKTHILEQTKENAELDRSFIQNLHFRYINSEEWSNRTAEAINLESEIKTIIRRTSQLSYMKILMREEFQKFKMITRKEFLNELINEIGKDEFDYMRIEEICEFVSDGKRISMLDVKRRRQQVVFELKNDIVRILYEPPVYVEIKDEKKQNELTGDVLIGTGVKRYTVRKIEQDEEGLKSFEDFLEKSEHKKGIAIITNVLRPFLVPKLKNFGVLITQYGGYTSHASVLCRELGINSMISVNNLINSLETGDYIEIDFQEGTIKKVDSIVRDGKDSTEITINLNSVVNCTNHEVGNKALNLIRINKISNTPKGFALTKYALKNIDNSKIQKKIKHEIKKLQCDKLAIRSSHEGEDENHSSCAGLFESYVNIKANDFNKIIDCIKLVYESKNTDFVNQYTDAKKGEMHVIIQEMISADVSGVMLTSNPYKGLDYIMIEYIIGDLCHLMQGDITPLTSYISKTDIIQNNVNYLAYPSIITDTLHKQYFDLLKKAVELEDFFSHRVEIEWGIKGGVIYIFQVRPY